ncbi:hypothetical protein G7L40_20675 [Paenibacillus polymyxa]|uniref:Uncharacterized protein n=1 Tax=Paenibacillus polymyxa TaxID=1406 RepID=A0A378Y0W6_PAEPO|nr:hypothetical protein [Paenibacillus polymyxa]MBE7896091.1 hypothetical protein [Paenibacillus polymyxa]MCC3256625.1 hypothetical protein [Paenibacillus polymyxa]QPK54887.1 hypothetical protein G7035_20730 [Paenibacillus polymyxa]QPK59975.1 hypothetical protein G7L40_20675 [Paenibacillus polymyxa]UOD84433.1 hypothetical protein CUU60_04165 [Paenibacillus polymyxa ATCC 842]
MKKYKLVAPQAEELNNFVVTIVADSNDADYITETAKYNAEEFNTEVINELIELKNNYSGYHQLSDCPLGEYITIPFNGCDGYCHSLESLQIKYVDGAGFTWDVELN